jgi:ribosome-binding factor A
MARVDKINELLQQKLAEAINREIQASNMLLTITFVKCSEDLKFATVGVSVLPEKYSGTALKILRKKVSDLEKTLKKQVSLFRVPRFNFVFDPTESRAAVIEEVIAAEEEEIKKLKD